MVKNYNEVLVDQYLKELLDEDPKYKDVCRCEQCVDDMKAMALNRLKPFYVTGQRGEVYGEYRNQVLQNKTDLILEIVKAVEFVSKHAH